MILSSRYHSVHPLPRDELKVGRRRKTSVLLDGVIQKNEELLRTTNNPGGYVACSVLDGNSR